MGILIEDSLNKVSKAQKQKLKSTLNKLYASNQKVDLNDIFKQIHFEGQEKPYASMKAEKINETDYKITFYSSDDLKKKLKKAITIKKDPLWVMYRQLKPMVRVPLPDPDEVLKNSELFTGVLERGTGNELISNYFRKCLTEKN